MSNESFRRSAAIPFNPRETIPVAPPLPVARPLQRARDVATRLFGYQSRSASPHGSPEEERHLSRLRSRYASLSATQNATASHKTGLEINTVAINEHGTHALLGGKEIFRTVKVEDGTFAQGYDLRGAIRSTPVNASGSARNRYAIDIADVAWAKGDCGDFVAAATSSGKIILYDLGHAGIQAAQLHEHFRQVHKVTFNPHRGCLLLSGSQDGTVRLWDVRDVRSASTLQSRRKYSGQSDGVRDVKWSPTDGVDFAFGTDSGWIQRWDLRNLKTALVKIPAHSETCNSIDWHPDGKHIASASSDKTVRIWDFSTSRRPAKASWEIKAPHRIMNARWRPSSESSMPKDSGARQCTQLVTTYDQEHSVVHVWDFRRPTLPFRELFPYATAPTDLLWHSQDLLWLVGREGTFLQADIQHAPKVIDKRNLQAFVTSTRGDVSFVTQKRPRKRVAPPQHTKELVGSLSSSRSQSPQRENLLSRSWVDDGLDEAFLYSKRSKPTQQPAFSLTRAPSLPTSSLHSESFIAPAATLELGEVLSDQRALRPRQVALYGPLPYCLDPKLFELMAQSYKVDLSAVPDDEMFLSAFESLLEHNARVAYTAGLYRTAQTWRILNFTMTNHLQKRAELKAQRQTEDKQTIRTSSTLVEILHKLPGDFSKSSIQTSPASLKPVSALTQQLALSDRASDQQTPLAKPTISLNNVEKPNGEGLPDFDEEAPLVLPPSVSPPATHDDNNIAPKEADKSSSQLTSSNLNGLQSLQKNSVEADKRAMVRRWSIQPKEPLRLDPVDSAGVVIPAPKLQRHNSDESFTFLEGSGGSRDRSFASSFRSNHSGPEDMVMERPSRSTVKENDNEKDKEFEFLGIETQDFDDRPEASTGPEESHMPETGEAPFDMSGDFVGDDLATAVEKNTSSQQLADANGLGGHSAIPVRDSSRRPKFTPPTVIGAGSRIHTNDDTRSLTHSKAATPAVYRPDDADIDFEATKAFTMVGMLRKLVAYYASKHDSQTVAQMILVLTPLLPRTQTLPDPELTQTVSAFSDAFTAAGFAPDEIEAILATQMEPVVRAGMQPLQIEAVLSAYYDQLLSRQLYNEAAALRRLAYPLYPAVYEDAVKDNHVHVRCGSCRKPMVSGALAKLRCESCGTKQAACAFCWLGESPFPFDETTADVSSTPSLSQSPSSSPPPPQHTSHSNTSSSSSLMTTCLRCNHTTHASCLRIWFAEGDGGCPTEGCLCDCVAGSWRDEKTRLVAAAKEEAAEHRRRRPRSHARVKSDEVSVRESEAVELARESLKMGTEGGKGEMVGSGSGSAG